jgi:hypothetical protein
MQISSLNTYASVPFEATQHKAGCQCPGCCKKEGAQALNGTQETPKEDDVKKDEETSKNKAVKSDSELTASELQQVSELRQIDSQVRAHEAAHIAAGGSAISGGASFTYQKGPDGQLYAGGGEVPISSAGASTPEAKIAIAREMQAGALAPANPSPQDLKVAASAAQMEAQARQELNAEKSEEQKEEQINTYSNNQDALNKEQDTSNIDLSA